MEILNSSIPTTTIKHMGDDGDRDLGLDPCILPQSHLPSIYSITHVRSVFIFLN